MADCAKAISGGINPGVGSVAKSVSPNQPSWITGGGSNAVDRKVAHQGYRQLASQGVIIQTGVAQGAPPLRIVK